MENIFLVLFSIILLVIGALVFLFVVFNTRKNELIQQKLKEALAHQEKVHELQLNALRGQMNPHFVHNSLNAIQYYIQMNDVESSEKYLSKFSKLMRLFFEYSRKKQISIADEIKLLNNYLEIEKLRFEDKLNYVIIIDPLLDIEDEQLPVMILQPIVENAINHGIFHKSTKGTVSITFKKIHHGFRIYIEDDGIGILKSKQLQKNLLNRHKPHSSNVVEDRLQLLKESNLFDISYSIQDVSETGKTGTKVVLDFNLNL
ncbi:MAG: histidine kinase transcriptional regulator protein [Flavobacteriaceae bacterium]|nr:MAG: histidine kinase transcriptional regulator protein [Flavobacteriaceae bacterium]